MSPQTPESCWWTSISTAELLTLRRRLLEEHRREFGDVLGDEFEDAVQHAFVALLRRPEDVSAANDGLYRYLRIVSHNHAIDRLRAEKRKREHLPQVALLVERHPAKAVSPPDEPPITAEEHEKIWHVFCALDEAERLIVWSHVVERRSIRAIADEMDLNWHRVDGIVKKSLGRIRRALKY